MDRDLSFVNEGLRSSNRWSSRSVQAMMALQSLSQRCVYYLENLVIRLGLKLGLGLVLVSAREK